MDLNERNSTTRDVQVSKEALDLPVEITSDIFCRLPIESILRCKSVCKTWYGITRDPYFISELLNSHHQPSRLILKPLHGKDPSNTSSHLVLVDLEEHKTRCIPTEKSLLGLRIMCACNGLLCLALEKKVSPVVIYNPITGEQVELPSSASKHTLRDRRVGLGFDISSGKYKVVNAYSILCHNVSITKFEVITLGDESWREIIVPDSLTNLSVVGVVFSNGSLYWKLLNDHHGVIAIHIFGFNLSEEKLDFIHVWEERVPLDLMDLGGHLTVVERFAGRIKIWRLTGSTKEGNQTFCLERDYEMRVMWGSALYYSVITESDDNSFLLKVGYRSRNFQQFEHLTWYFPWRTLYEYLDIPGLPQRFYAVCFKPSLVSPVAPPTRSSRDL
ncbi:hypothetical protein NMG60_11005813 [Bertholletia excelsa]